MNARGFVLLEVIVALVILSVAGAATTALLNDALRILTRIESETAALRAAREVADSLVAVGAAGAGERTTPWGRVAWGGGEDGLAVRAFVRTGPSTAEREVAALPIAP